MSRPTHSTPRSSPSGTGAPMRSSQRSRPPRWLQRCTRGHQPPETGRDAVGPAVRLVRRSASIVPGRSLSAKSSGRSIAPVASTIRCARIRQSAPPALDRDRRSRRRRARRPRSSASSTRGRPSEPDASSAGPARPGSRARRLRPRPRGRRARRRRRARRSARASCRSAAASAGDDEPPLARERLGDEPVLELDERRAQHRLRADLDERVRLLLAGREDAARRGRGRCERKPPRTPLPHERRRERLALAALVLSRRRT